VRPLRLSRIYQFLPSYRRDRRNVGREGAKGRPPPWPGRMMGRHQGLTEGRDKQQPSHEQVRAGRGNAALGGGATLLHETQIWAFRGIFQPA
jgi:hypothetical protein